MACRGKAEGEGWGVDQAIVLWMAAAVLSLAGLAGMVLPALPGAPLLFAGLFCAA